MLTEEEAEMARALSGLSLDVDKTSPGSLVTVTTEAHAAPVFRFERAIDGAWVPVVNALFGVPIEYDDQPRVVPLGEGFDYNDFGGLGPQRVAIPVDAAPGRTASAASTRPTRRAPVLLSNS